MARPSASPRRSKYDVEPLMSLKSMVTSVRIVPNASARVLRSGASSDVLSGNVSSDMLSSGSIKSGVDYSKVAHDATKMKWGKPLRVIAIENPTQAAQQRTFLAASTCHARNGRHNASRKSAQRQRLQPDLSGTPKRRKEQAFSAEQRALDLADILDVVRH